MAVSDAFGYFFSTYLPLKYECKVSWSIEMTTKRNRKAVYGDPDDSNKYTMFVKNTTTGKLIAQSDEFVGYNKSQWSGEGYAKFLATLKEPT